MAEVTYYFDARTVSQWADPDYMIDGILTNFASETSNEEVVAVSETTSPGTDLGTITKVELRAYGYGDGDDRIDFYFQYSVQYELTMPSSAGWSAYTDVTSDPYVDGWTWAKVQDPTPNLIVEFDKVGKGNTMYCAKVEIRVTYTPSGGAYYRGLTVQGVGELALCDVGSNPLRIRKGGVTYGIELVETDDPNASIVRIKIGAGIKAIRKYT